MTELALNLVWAIIAAASYVVLFRQIGHRRAQRERGPSQTQRIIALTCFLALLFPVISLTDDLHEIQATAEDASLAGAIIKKCSANHVSDSLRTFHQPSVTPSSFAAAARWAESGEIRELRITVVSPAANFSALGRAPPAFARSTLI